MTVWLMMEDKRTLGNETTVGKSDLEVRASRRSYSRTQTSHPRIALMLTAVDDAGLCQRPAQKSHIFINAYAEPT